MAQAEIDDDDDDGCTLAVGAVVVVDALALGEDDECEGVPPVCCCCPSVDATAADCDTGGDGSKTVRKSHKTTVSFM